MTLPHDTHGMSVEAYLRLNEADPEHRYEYIDGDVYMRVNANIRHAAISTNMGCILENFLHDSPCVVYNSQAWVRLSDTRYVYPDLTVSCSSLDYDDEENGPDMIQHPCLVGEVLSSETRERDLGIKARIYRECPTIREFLLVDTAMPQVQLHRRANDGLWTLSTLSTENEVELTSLGVRFPVTDLYKKTRFSRSSAE